VRPFSATLILCLAAAGLTSPGCGKKGPPLAPIVRVPGRAMDLKARRVGSTVTLTFTIPSANMDDTRPADIGKVEVYAYTALNQNDVRDLRRMKLLKTITVRKPPEAEPAGKPGKPGQPATPAGPARPVKPAAPPVPGEEQGALITVTETLDAGMLTALAPDGKKTGPDAKSLAAASLRPRGPFDPPAAEVLAGPAPSAEAHRFYLVYGVSRSGNRGGASPRPPVPLSAAPGAPAQPDLKSAEGGVVVSWSIPSGERLPYQEPAAAAGQKEGAPAQGKTGEEEGKGAPEAAAEEPPVLAAKYSGGLEPAPDLSYVVYLVPRVPAAAAAPAATQASPAAAAPVPQAAVRLTDAPVKGLTWTDTGAAFGIERCYDVRTVVVQGPATLESQPSPVACITPADTFPPPAPASLAAVAGEGAVSLIWAGVDAADLAGYLVLRADGPDAPLTPVFDTPIRETTYRDATVKPGVRHVYAVVAVDRAVPPNRSALSNKVEETAR